MGPVRILILVVALAAAIGAVVLVRGMSKAQEPKIIVAAAPAAVEKPTAQVLVAKRDLRVGAKLVAEDMTWQAWPQDSLNAAFIVNQAPPKPTNETARAASAAVNIAKVAVGSQEPALLALVGAVVREPILANEPMTDRKLVRAGNAGIMAISLEPGMRAMAVPLSAESAAGGFILPGDHVDVVMTHQLEGAGGGKRFTSDTVLKNVRVLAIDQTTVTPKGGSAVVGATATLELSSKQSEVLALSKAQGDLTLVLRSYADASGPAVTVAQGDSDAAFRAAVVRVYKNGSASGSTTEVTVTR
jgi:pilus assembly protein CpaB